MIKSRISNLLRKLRLIYLIDRLRFYVEKFRNRKVNRAFRKQHPEIKLPPDYLIYESFRIHYPKYYSDSRVTAEKVAGYLQKYLSLENQKILDWGCGPGRVIRHFPEVVGNGCSFFGTDYNASSIEWCRQNLPGIDFNLNSLEPDLPYDDNFFDAIYGISIFTHLSEPMHYAWMEELYRILKPGGVMYLTTQGEKFRVKLTVQEQQQFNRGQLVVRGQVKEGHRTYSAFHPRQFMEKLFARMEILEHVVPEAGNTGWIPQDIWLLRK